MSITFGAGITIGAGVAVTPILYGRMALTGI